MFDATSIKVLSGLDAVRKRPGMYVGDTNDGTGLHTVLYEVIGHAIEEARAGFANEVSVTLNADGSATVRCDGRGLPADSAEATMTQLHGIGLGVVNALSERIELRTWRNREEHVVRFRNGVAEAPLAVVGAAGSRHGTEITFLPSPEVFRNVTRFDAAALEQRLRELAALTPGVRVVLDDKRYPGSPPRAMRYPNGLADLVRHVDGNRTPLIDRPVVIAGERNGVRVEAALWWNDLFGEHVLCFTNTIPQREGGTHLAGLRAALGRIICGYAAANTAQEQVGLDGGDACEGLTAVLSVWAPDPQFSQTKDELASPEVKAIVEEIVGDQFATWMEKHPREAMAVAKKAVEAAVARSAARVERGGTAAIPGLIEVRQCPQAYIGNTGDGTGLINMVYEVLDYALDEVRLGYATEIGLALNADGSATVRHNGHGFDTNPEIYGCGFPELLGPGMYGVPYNRYRVPGNLESAGLCAVNALSSCLEVRIWRGGQEHLVRFRDGRAEAPFGAVGPADGGKRGMEITFWPSLEVFKPVTDFDYATLERRLHELACFRPGLRLAIEDKRPGGKKPERIQHNGIADLVRHIDRTRKPFLAAPIEIVGVSDDSDPCLDFTVAFWWTDSPHEQVLCFTENLPQHQGGSHRDGFYSALGRIIAQRANASRSADEDGMPVTGEDARAGLTAVLALWTPHAQFADDTKNELVMADAKYLVESVVAQKLSNWLDAHPNQEQAILARARRAASGRAIFGLARWTPVRRR